jgi:hypothetical protein
MGMKENGRASSLLIFGGWFLCFSSGIDDIYSEFSPTPEVAAIMRDNQSDSFREPILRGHLGDVKPRGRTARWTMRAGTVLFWSLVISILSARALYFDPDFATKFSQLTPLSRSVRAMLGV